MWRLNIVLILVICVHTSGQEKLANKMKETPHAVPTFEVKFEPDPKLEVPFQGDDAIYSEGCDAAGNPYVQVNKTIPPHSNEVFKFSENGIVSFETSKISDIVEPKWIADFASDSEVYMLIEGDTRTKEHRQNIEGLGDEVSWETTGEPRYYIARFDADGSYKGALKLDLALRPVRLSGFPSGNFLVAGPDGNHILRVALLGSGGQLLRYIELPKEKDGKWEEAEQAVTKSAAENTPPEIIAYWLASETSFLPYQSGVLYVRGHTGALIYEINAGGEAHAVKIKSRDGYSVEYMLPSDRNWFVVSTESGQNRHAKSVLDELNPSSGELLARYLVEGVGHTKVVAEGQSDVACFHEGQFVSVRHQGGKLTVLHGEPMPAKN